MKQRCFAIALAILCVGCRDEVPARYANRQAALENGVIAKGWLPSFIPESAQQIRLSNNLDLNISTGSFTFKAQEWSRFEAHLKPLANTTPPFSNWHQTEEEYKSRGYEAWSHAESGNAWVFFCKPREGKCEHFMWVKSPSREPKQ